MEKKIQINERIFVAGAKGMAGTAICKALRQNGYGKYEDGKILTPSRQELDLFDFIEVSKWFEINKPTIVILAAAKVGGILANSTKPTEFILENLKIQNNVIENAWKFGVKRLLFLGSSCIYPKHSKQPIKEESLLSGSLETTNSWYAIAKISGIKLCEALRKQHNFDAISLMPTNLYGPGDNYHSGDSHVMASLIKKFCEGSKKSLPSITCWGSGSPYREFMHVDDLGSAVVHVLEFWDPNEPSSPKDSYGNPLNILNVGTGDDITIKNLAKKISSFTNYKGDIIWDTSKPDGTPRKVLNIDRIRDLGWQPKIGLNEGIKETIKNYVNNT